MKKLAISIVRVLGLMVGVFLLTGSAGAQLAQDSTKTIAFTKHLNSSEVNQEANPAITLELDQVPLKKALKQIAGQANAGLYYNSAFLPEKTVSLRLQAVPLDKALRNVLVGTSLKAITSGRNITLEWKRATAKIQRPLVNIQETISGAVTDGQSGETLPGVNILVKGTSTGASTDANGAFELTVESLQDTLVVTYIGYQRQEVPIDGRTRVDIQLSPEAIMGEEMVVVGYGEQKKSDLTGSVVSVSEEDFEQTSTGSFESLLQGRVPGLRIIDRNNDNPEGGTTVRVRGISSITGSNAPLVVLDGIPMGDAGGINSINPEIIASIEVLKDASATAIYGSRGAGGVIMVTTKQGEKGNSNVWLNLKQSFSTFSDELDYWKNPLKMAKLTDEARINANLDPLYIGEEDVNGTYYPSIADIESGDWPYYTDWTDYVFRNTAFTSDINLGVQGGSDNNRYLVSLGYYNGQGMQQEDDYNKISLDLSYEHEINQQLTVRTNSGFFTAKRNLNYGMNYGRNPLYPVFNEDGSYYKMNSRDYGNPVALTNERYNKRADLTGYATLQFDWEITNFLQFVLRGNARAGTISSNFYNPTNYTLAGDLHNGEGGTNSSSNTDLTFDSYLTYSETIGEDHDLTIMAGTNYEYSRNNGLNTTGEGFSNDVLGSENLSGAEDKYINNYRIETILASGFTRFQYSYKDRYLATFTSRIDGSSKFGKNNKWGFFPSGALSWILSEENFIKNLNFFDHLKLRTSVGISGNQGIAPYQTFAQFGQAYYYLNGEEYITHGIGREIGREGQGNRYALWGGMASNDLRWEETFQFNLGLDMSLLSNRLDFTVDYYYKRTYNLLRQQFMNPSTGFDRVWTNDGDLENKGVELGLDGRIFTKGKLQLNAGFIFNLNRNKVLNIGSQKKSGYIEDENGIKYEPYGGGVYDSDFLNVLAIGYPINSFYGYQVDGIIQEMPDNPVSLTSAGELNYIGLNSDGTLNSNARTIIGDPNPDFTSSFNLQLRHQSGFDLSILLYLVYGRDIFSTRRLNRPSLEEKRWTAENPNNKYPSLRSTRQYFASSWFIEDGSFFRIKNITLGYTLPEISFLQKGRAYINVSNPFTFSKTTEYDPEVGENGRGGTPYPRVMMLTAGLEFQF